MMWRIKKHSDGRYEIFDGSGVNRGVYRDGDVAVTHLAFALQREDNATFLLQQIAGAAFMLPPELSARIAAFFAPVTMEKIEIEQQ